MTNKSAATKMEYWVEVNHSDLCTMCRDGMPGCASGRPNQRIRVAKFLYFMEAIDYCQDAQRKGVQTWLRKPRYVSFPTARTKSDYSHYPVKDGKPDGILTTPIILDGKPGKAESEAGNA
jgi:hypothetical protein